MDIWEIIAIAGLVFGFGFVVFFHELGHFLAAKWVGIRVEQFAVGFGQAILSWRQGMGWNWGSSGKKLEELAKAGGDMSRYGETEYRLNWIPLGGYVKMLGQDDMNPNAQVEDPRSYNKKSIGARMVVVSAGVIMNVILAALLFMVVFLIGFKVQPPIVGSMQVNSPAQLGGLAVGDRILELGGKRQYDVKDLLFTAALANPGETMGAKVLREGKELELKILPQRDPMTSFLGLGVGSIAELRGLDAKLLEELKKAEGVELDPGAQVLPGDVITAVNGTSVGLNDYAVLDQAVQESAGRPVSLTVRDVAGKTREVKAPVSFQLFFGDTPVNIAGLQPRPKVDSIDPESPVKGKLKEGDVVCGLKVNGEPRMSPSMPLFIQLVNKAGQQKWKVDFYVERGGQRQWVEGVVPDFRTGPGKRGVGIRLTLDDQKPIVAAALASSAGAGAKIPDGARIVKIDGQAVENWFDIRRLLGKSSGSSVIVHQELDAEGNAVGAAAETTARLDEDELRTLANVRYAHGLALHERIEPRQTNNPLVAAAWGVTETRDLLIQFYLTLRRLVQGSVGVSNFMGPVGIMHAGSVFAFKGWDWLLWFLAMISANLAVVNFLPIPIVDGGLFVFLIVEKIQGKPLSARMQTVAQMVGLAIILSVFLLVTYQDIARIFL